MRDRGWSTRAAARLALPCDAVGTPPSIVSVDGPPTAVVMNRLLYCGRAIVWLTDARTFMVSFSVHREVDVRQPVAVVRLVAESQSGQCRRSRWKSLSDVQTKSIHDVLLGTRLDLGLLVAQANHRLRLQTADLAIELRLHVGRVDVFVDRVVVVGGLESGCRHPSSGTADCPPSRARRTRGRP